MKPASPLKAASPIRPPLTLDTIPGYPMPPRFKSKHEAREARFSVRPMSRGGFSVFYCDRVTTARSGSERGAWSLIVGAA